VRAPEATHALASLWPVGNPRLPWAALLTLVCAVLLAAAPPATAQVPDPRGVDPLSVNPLLGQPWYAPKGEHPAWRQYRRYLRQGKRHRADLIWKLAREPKFQWFGRFTRPRMRKKIRRFFDSVPAGTLPLMTVMRHQGRACGGDYDGGGPREDARTRKWYRRFARAVGSRRAVIAFEPDSLGTIDCLAPRWRGNRLDLLRYGVDVLSKLPNATIYLEAGASDWENPRRTAKQLRYIGIHKVRGFMLNVTHNDWTLANIRHGLQISRRTGGKPFIVNTATNGRGPVHYKNAQGRRINVWCHPRWRGLGIPPTTETHHRKVDAYMWINRPGYSGGACNGGPLPIGAWWPKRALQLAKFQTRWIRPPRGTRYGLFKRYTLRDVAGDGFR
jgi:endoglucanase